MSSTRRLFFPTPLLFSLVLTFVVPSEGVPQPAYPGVAEATQEVPSAEGIVRELYDMVTFPKGTTPDWGQFRALFLPESVVVLRSTREATSVFTLEGFIQDWLDFIEGSKIEETGFTERIIRTHSTEFGDIAHVWVLYEAEIPGWGRPPQQGVDSFQLVRREGAWKIASILNEIPTPERPIPEVLRGEG
ncbi:MAG: hypothetical protein HKO65_15900 [Gemmatimonadetes bacterium]|nr:hypothetical protein [Gemmatimonadota bacterium]NNM06577.1 hypothetical protein [Gemmatimonadota bacterium]